MDGVVEMSSHEIVFFEDEHKYLVDGKEIPSVTDILEPLHKSYKAVNPSVLQYAANRGTAVHSVLELYDLGAELEATPETEPYIRAYLEWSQVYKPTWIGVEQIVFCEEGWFIGTLDRVGYLNGNELAIVDIKTSTPNREAYVSVCLQTMAYAMAWASENDLADRWRWDKISRYGVFLMKDGKYRCIKCNEWEGTNHIDSAEAFRRLLFINKMIDKLLETGGKK